MATLHSPGLVDSIPKETPEDRWLFEYLMGVCSCWLSLVDILRSRWSSLLVCEARAAADLSLTSEVYSVSLDAGVLADAGGVGLPPVSACFLSSNVQVRALIAA